MRKVLVRGNPEEGHTDALAGRGRKGTAETRPGEKSGLLKHTQLRHAGYEEVSSSHQTLTFSFFIKGYRHLGCSGPASVHPMPSAEMRRELLAAVLAKQCSAQAGCRAVECRGQGDLRGTGGSHDRTMGLEDENRFHGPCRHQVSDVPLHAHAIESSMLPPARCMPGSSATLYHKASRPHLGKSAEVPARPPANPGLQAGGPTFAFEMNGSGHEAAGRWQHKGSR